MPTDTIEDIVSIIAPAYNHEKYIIDSLSSISQQTYYNKELIIIDDCSMDSTPVLIKKYLDRDVIHEIFPAGVKFIRHEKNMNAHKTIDEGIHQASGKYISIINTDDCYEPERLKIMLAKLKEENARLAFSQVRCIDSQSHYIENRDFEDMREMLKIYPETVFPLMIKNVAIGTGNFLFDKDLYYEIGGFSFDYHFIHDWDFILKSALISNPIYVEETNYLYRFHNTNTIKQVSENEEKKDIEVKSVLSGFLSNILMGNVKNPILKNIHMLDYFFELIPDEYSSYLWKKLRKKEIYGV